MPINSNSQHLWKSTLSSIFRSWNQWPQICYQDKPSHPHLPRSLMTNRHTRSTKSSIPNSSASNWSTSSAGLDTPTLPRNPQKTWSTHPWLSPDSTPHTYRNPNLNRQFKPRNSCLDLLELFLKRESYCHKPIRTKTDYLERELVNLLAWCNCRPPGRS